MTETVAGTGREASPRRNWVAEAAAASVLGAMAIEGSVSTTVGKKQGNELSGQIGVRIGF